MKTTKAKHNGREIIILYVNSEVTWVIASCDVEKHSKRFKLDVIELEEYCVNDLHEMSQQERRGN